MLLCMYNLHSMEHMSWRFHFNWPSTLTMCLILRCESNNDHLLQWWQKCHTHNMTRPLRNGIFSCCSACRIFIRWSTFSEELKSISKVEKYCNSFLDGTPIMAALSRHQQSFTWSLRNCICWCCLACRTFLVWSTFSEELKSISQVEKNCSSFLDVTPITAA